MSYRIVLAALPALATAPHGLPRDAAPHAVRTEAPRILRLEPFELPMIVNGNISGHLTARLAAEAQDSAALVRLNRTLPVLRAQLLAALLEFGRLHGSSLTAPDAQRLSLMLNSRDFTPQDEVRRVLILDLTCSPS
ncbi:hypothetical protein [Sphingomonas morindae]|uniref:Uncharacterized protein n=1 Tax=Sphingomonas morindae TaxID=1541170 RepID=A0ABY4X565_9SPHN|nr:hypothetical protein [Sphingomonas morindae]USI71987.1 hypothetical protein LHA26_11775 [Sphingomonas morindae]